MLEKNPTPTSFEIPQEHRGWTCFFCKAGTWPVEEAQRNLSQGTHATEPQRPRAEGFFGRLHSHATAIVRKSNISENGRAQMSSCSSVWTRYPQPHLTTSESKLETHRGVAYVAEGRHATEINGRTCKWLKEECSPYDGPRVKDASELRPSRREWQVLQQQPEALEKY